MSLIIKKINNQKINLISKKNIKLMHLYLKRFMIKQFKNTLEQRENILKVKISQRLNQRVITLKF